MITPERVYEVFGITPGPWEIKIRIDDCFNPIESIGKIEPGFDQADDVWLNISTEDSKLASSVPEMLVALVNIAVEMEPYHNSGFEDKGLYISAIKIIESADSKNRPWSELLKEFRNG